MQPNKSNQFCLGWGDEDAMRLSSVDDYQGGALDLFRVPIDSLSTLDDFHLSWDSMEKR